MKKILILAAALWPLCIMAQDSDKVSIKPYGFIRNYFNFDSRETYTVIGGEYNMIPYDQDLHDGVDLNAVPQAQLQALTSRFGVALLGPSIFGWQSSGKLEADFGGFGTTNSVLRIRLAYLKLHRVSEQSPSNSTVRTSEVLIGQDWHPLSGDIMPEVLGMAAGAPFRPHSRTPQLRATSYWGNIGVTASLLYQLQYMNNGPASATSLSSVSSIDFANNAILPEAFIGLNIRTGSFYGQIGVDAQVIRPRTHAVVKGKYTAIDETVESLTPTLYAQYTDGPLSIKFRTLLAQNTSHLNQLSGYGITALNEDGTFSYAPLKSSVSYLNIAYGNKYRVNLFLGYMKNLGASSDLLNFGSAAAPAYHIYMKGGENFTHLNSIYRISPSISYNVRAFNLGLEYEYTACTYGDLASNGSIVDNANLHLVANHRVCLLVKYNF